MNEYLVRITVNRPVGMDDSAWAALLQREAQHGRRYHEQATIVRIWRIPGTTANVGVWAADSATELHELLAALPAFEFMSIDVQPLARHYLEC